jgi:hypothetical protein
MASWIMRYPSNITVAPILRTKSGLTAVDSYSSTSRVFRSQLPVWVMTR